MCFFKWLKFKGSNGSLGVATQLFIELAKWWFMLVVYFSKHVSRNPAQIVGGIVKPTNNQWLNWIYSTNLWIYLLSPPFLKAQNSTRPPYSVRMGLAQACLGRREIHPSHLSTDTAEGGWWDSDEACPRNPWIEKKYIFRTELCGKKQNPAWTAQLVNWVYSIVGVDLHERNTIFLLGAAWVPKRSRGSPWKEHQPRIPLTMQT